MTSPFLTKPLRTEEETRDRHRAYIMAKSEYERLIGINRTDKTEDEIYDLDVLTAKASKLYSETYQAFCGSAAK